jgi:hypothetical protein
MKSSDNANAGMQPPSRVLSFWKFQRFLWRRGYEAYADKETISFGRTLRVFYIFCAVLGVVAAGLIAFCESQQSPP